LEKVSSISKPGIEFFSILLDLFWGKNQKPDRDIRDFDIPKKLEGSDSN
jgi:hypothetical protein